MSWRAFWVMITLALLLLAAIAVFNLLDHGSIIALP